MLVNVLEEELHTSCEPPLTRIIHESQTRPWDALPNVL
jgi:hypothetical protein